MSATYPWDARSLEDFRKGMEAREQLSIRIGRYYQKSRNIPQRNVVHVSFNPDSVAMSRQLFERIRRELGRKHIEQAPEGYQITDAGVVRGQITDDRDSFERMPLLIIDGKPITWEALGRMIAPNTGFRFKLEIFDRSEEK